MSASRTAIPLPVILCLAWLSLVVLVCVLAPLIATHNPNANELTRMFRPPGTEGNLLGTDELGRDLFSRVVYGGQVALALAAAAAVIAGFIGTMLGIVAGYFRGHADTLLTRVSEIQFSIPAILLAVLIISFGMGGVGGLLVVLTMSSWPSFYRLARSGTLAVSRAPFIEAASITGASHLRVLWRHLLPSVLPVSVVTLTLEFSSCLLLVATLSFLGLGVPPPTPDWGTMVSSGQTLLPIAWWISGIPGFVIISIVLSANTVGDWLADRLNLGEVPQ